MKIYLLTFAVCILVAIGLTACGDTGSGQPSKATATAVPPKATVTIAASPMPTHASAGTLSYEEIQSTFQRIWNEDKKIQDTERRYKRVRDYRLSLNGKKVTGWHGWVFQVYEEKGGDAYVGMLFEDPYKDGPTVPKEDYELEDTTGRFDLEISDRSQIQSLKIGEEVVFSGTIRETEESGAVGAIVVSMMQPANIQEATPELPADLQDVVITLGRTECFGACPIYKLTIKGDGTVEYEGEQFVAITGTVTSAISAEDVRKLVSEFEKVDYFSLNNSYTSEDVTDSPSANTSITIGGRQKSINHYLGDDSTPPKLTILEDKIDDITNSDQWISKKPEPTKTVP